MIRALQIAKIALLLSGAALCVFGCWAVVRLVESEQKIAQDADATVKAASEAATKIGAAADNVNEAISQTKPEITETLGRADDTMAQLNKAAVGLNAAVAEINAPCLPGPCGTLADVNRTLGSVRLAVGQVTAFSLHEQTQLDQVNAQETAVAQLTQADLAKLGSAIDGVTALTGDANLKGSLNNLDTSTAALAGMATDTEQAWHAMLHPKWPKRIWNAVTGIGVDAAKVFF